MPLPPALTATRPGAAYARASLAPATFRAYQAGWLTFAKWCQLSSRIALPAAPETVAEHLASLATTVGRASLTKRLAAIGQYHRLANQPFAADHPVIHHTLRGIHRAHGRPARRSAALAAPEIKRLVAACRTRSLADLRDRALLLLGYAGALRRAELVAIEREHVSFTAEGLRLQIPHSKIDTTGRRAGRSPCYNPHRWVASARRAGADAETGGVDVAPEVRATENSMSAVDDNSADQNSADQDFDERVRVRAYLMWEADGKPTEQEDLYWHRARERMEAETHSSYPPAQSGKHRS